MQPFVPSFHLISLDIPAFGRAKMAGEFLDERPAGNINFGFAALKIIL